MCVRVRKAELLSWVSMGLQSISGRELLMASGCCFPGVSQ